ncbi:HNH endonuclease [Actinoplanes xinjiangensis]|uniref:HNH endonuclease n=1 Tax=Actinoplanes xinjiangensis TaxID=512350 RepID=A0A316EGH3_9ACTN|nr:HNH endonuclease [Actinoplanes xinjiangensis]PWK30800.1 HNH endonuclease [Actinoplanes xinjiangensis]GIF44246.1 HNH endonuclease [Actinoplanes xinjiangensis]
MWSLPKPQHTAQETYEAAISRMRDKDLHAVYRSATGTVTAAAANYAAAAEQGLAHALLGEHFEAGAVTRKQMITLYDDRMAHPKGPARHIYNAIRARAPYDRCPSCGHRDARTLDHVLPKTKFPALAVTPLNLVPACHECNKRKGNQVAASAETAAVHPYYDSFDTDRWLHAAVEQDRPPAVRYFVEAPQHWAAADQARARHHFDGFGLGALYTAQAAQELANLEYRLGRLAAAGGADGVRDFLQENADSCRHARLNSWQTAMYVALSESDWFCDGGFKLG